MSNRLCGRLYSLFVPDQLPDVYHLKLHIIQCDEDKASKSFKSIRSIEYEKTGQFPILYSFDYKVEGIYLVLILNFFKKDIFHCLFFVRVFRVKILFSSYN